MNLNYLIHLSYGGVVAAAYFCLTTTVQARAVKQTDWETEEQKELSSRRRTVVSKISIEDIPLRNATSTSTKNLLAQQGITRVTGVELNQTDRGLEVILETAAESERSEQSQEKFSPRVGVVYQPIEPVSLYASYSTSFNPDPFNSTTVDGEVLEPSTGTQYELGVKGEFLNSNLTTTLAFYQIDRDNSATTDPDNPDFSIAAGEVRSRGIELDVAGEVLPGSNVIAAYAYTDAEITEDNDFPVGNRLENVPENSASLWTTYQIQQGSLQGLGLGAGVFFVGDRQGDLDNTFTLPSYVRTDAALFYRRDDWQANLNFQNLFDVDYIRSSETFREYLRPGDPFTVIGSVAVRF